MNQEQILVGFIFYFSHCHSEHVSFLFFLFPERLFMSDQQRVKKKVRPGGDYCSAYGCNSRPLSSPGLSFFRFPNEKQRSMHWKWRPIPWVKVTVTGAWCLMKCFYMSSSPTIKMGILLRVLRTYGHLVYPLRQPIMPHVSSCVALWTDGSSLYATS